MGFTVSWALLHSEMNRLVMMTHFFLLGCFSTFPAQKQGGKSDGDSSYALLLLGVHEVFPKRQSLSLWELSCFASFSRVSGLFYFTAWDCCSKGRKAPNHSRQAVFWSGQGWAQANDPKWDTNECCLGTEPYSCNLAASDPLQWVPELKLDLFRRNDGRLCACSYGARGPDAWDLFVSIICSSVIY